MNANSKNPRKRFYIAIDGGVRTIVSLDPCYANSYPCGWLLGSFKSKALAEYVRDNDQIYTEHEAIKSFTAR
jgi:hypothetical protein